jgi:DNA-binding transcriptional LysR family regulator
MDLRSLRHVVSLARLGSYTKAAEHLGLSQPALSRSIQSIEQRAKVRLFDRDRGGVHLTAVGRAFVARATEVLREADDLDRMLEQAAGGARGDVAFGMAPLPAAALLPRVLASRLAQAPDLRSQVTVRDATALLVLLTSEEIEFFVAAEGQLPENAPVNTAALGRFPTSLIVRAGHPLLQRDEAPSGARFPLIVAASTREFANPADAMPYVLDGAPHLVLDDYGALTVITEGSDAIWLSSAFAVPERILAGRLNVLPPGRAEGPPEFQMMLYSLARRSLSPAALAMRDQLRAQVRTLSAQLAPSGGA